MDKTKKTITKKEKEPKAAVKKRARKVAQKPAAKPAEKTAEPILAPEAKAEKYHEAVGRRKTSTARVRLWTRGDKTFLVNEKPLETYFPTFELQQTALAALNTMKCLDKFGVVIRVAGGGVNSQAEAVRHGISKALVLFNPDFRKRLKKAGYLIRDPRMRERKKFGLKRERRAPQWAKR